MKFSDLVEKINEVYPEVMGQPGEVFFGSRDSLNESNGIAIVGLNPGGNGQLSTIRENLDNYEKNIKRDDFSGYLDQCWHEPEFSEYRTCEKCETSLKEKGIVHQVRHQRMIKEIADEVGENYFNLRRTISTNAIWVQTRSATKLRELLKKQGTNTRDIFKEKYFKIFNYIFAECKIDFVLCLGNGAYESPLALFAHALGVKEFNNIGNNYRDGKFFTANIDGRCTTFLGIAHPSMHTTTANGIEKIKEQLQPRSPENHS